MNPISQGLTISVLGLLITFLALGVFIFIMLILQRIFPPKTEAEDNIEKQPAHIDQQTGDEDEALVAAAIGVALSTLRVQEQSRIGETLTSGRGSWWVANRMNYQKKINLQRR